MFNVREFIQFKKWNVSKGLNFSYMFYKCKNIFNLEPLKDWKVLKDPYISDMFSECNGWLI